jgi:hypothetical protein
VFDERIADAQTTQFARVEHDAFELEKGGFHHDS